MYGLVYIHGRRTDGRADGRAVGRADRQMKGRTSGWTGGQTDMRVEGRTDTDRLTDGRADGSCGWADKQSAGQHLSTSRHFQLITPINPSQKGHGHIYMYTCRPFLI